MNKLLKRIVLSINCLLKNRPLEFYLIGNVLGYYSAIKYLVFDLMDISRCVDITVDGVKVTVRTNTPDIIIAISGLAYIEYANIKCREPKFIIDLGANIGTSALFFSRKYREALVVAIEPETSNYNLLIENTQGISNIKAVKAAVWSNSCVRNVRDRKTGPAGYSTTDSPELEEAVIEETRCVSINEIMKEFGMETIDILKVDIEGSASGGISL